MTTMPAKVIPIILMGCGAVGSQLLRHIISTRTLHAHQGIYIRVVGVSDSVSLAIVPDVSSMEIGNLLMSRVCETKAAGYPLCKLEHSGELEVYENPGSWEKIIDVAAQLGKSKGLVLVDCSASSETTRLLTKSVDAGCCVVMANKQPLTSTLEDFDKLYSRPRYIRHESTVGAGLPVISSLHRILSSGDSVRRIVASLSGTLGYVMSEVGDGKQFSEVVLSAKKLGYTEPDPRDDLNGRDVARKALILARLLGWRINLADIKIESLYPEQMGPTSMHVKPFLETGLPSLDEGIKKRVDEASLNGNVLRYVCKLEDSRCEVGIQELPKDSSLGRLRGSDNVMEIYSRCYNDQPLVIQGAGAGIDTTAAGVLADIFPEEVLMIVATAMGEAPSFSWKGIMNDPLHYFIL